ncbi:MAG: hypothetical protein NTW28_20320 [Candidatus Solibacter sp.]|nr:hypothetical protein [Candidatus Solibacter sp.]
MAPWRTEAERSGRSGDRSAIHWRQQVHSRLFGGGVRDITVLHHRVRATAAAAGVEDFRLTAHVLVHEIAHVLQRIDRHSDSGVMKAHWSQADYEVMARKPLPLAAEDIILIRRGLEGARDRGPAAGRE